MFCADRFMMVLICLIFSVLSTIENYMDFANQTLFWMVRYQLCNRLNSLCVSHSVLLFFCRCVTFDIRPSKSVSVSERHIINTYTILMFPDAQADAGPRRFTEIRCSAGQKPISVFITQLVQIRSSSQCRQIHNVFFLSKSLSRLLL